VSGTPFPWQRAIGLGLGVLKLSPDAFWRMTPRELACALDAIASPSAAPLERGELAGLMQRFPD
jgi:uncharacterized phage protein (TIGR02216 family)